MRALVQRVSEAGVYIEKENYTAEILKGMVILLGIKSDDSEEDVIFVADKCSNLRIFEDENEKMNLSLKSIDGEVLIISQFTLYGDAAKGRRPSFIEAARPETAIPLYEGFIRALRQRGLPVATGEFGADMQVALV